MALGSGLGSMCEPVYTMIGLVQVVDALTESSLHMVYTPAAPLEMISDLSETRLEIALGSG